MEWHLVGERNWNEGGRDVGLTPLYSAVRVTPRALSLAGDASKEKRDSNGAAEGKVAVGAVGTYINSLTAASSSTGMWYVVLSVDIFLTQKYIWV